MKSSGYFTCKYPSWSQRKKIPCEVVSNLNKKSFYFRDLTNKASKKGLFKA
jgi:hypothetical protein